MTPAPTEGRWDSASSSWPLHQTGSIAFCLKAMTKPQYFMAYCTVVDNSSTTSL